MLLLRNPIQPYAWGPIDGISRLVGSEPTGDHEAELWVGTHPRGPSVVVGGEHDGRTLAEVIAEDPARWLGDQLAAEGHTALPFLLKVLAIAQPLSLQAHPSAEQARAGFDREEAAGIPKDAPERLYADPYPKPEMLVALQATWVLTGFRDPRVAADLVAALSLPVLEPLVERLHRGGSQGLRDALEWLLRLDGDERSAVAEAGTEVADIQMAGGPVDGTTGRSNPYWWVSHLAELHPGDPTCFAPLLLELRELSETSSGPGFPLNAVQLAAGNLHAYLEGAGVEIMAASDNVLRGGLTPKHIDVPELLRVIAFEPIGERHDPVRNLTPSSGAPRHPFHMAVVFESDFEQFGLTRVEPGRHRVRREVRGSGSGELDVTSFDLVGGATEEAPFEVMPTQPSLLLVVGGEIDLAGPDGGLSVGHGDAAFVAPGEGPIAVQGTGTLWWATTRAGLPAGPQTD